MHDPKIAEVTSQRKWRHGGNLQSAENGIPAVARQYIDGTPTLILKTERNINSALSSVFKMYKYYIDSKLRPVHTERKRDRKIKETKTNIKENFRFRFCLHSLWMGLNTSCFEHLPPSVVFRIHRSNCAYISHEKLKHNEKKREDLWQKAGGGFLDYVNRISRCNDWKKALS